MKIFKKCLMGLILVLVLSALFAILGCSKYSEFEGEPVTGKRWRIDLIKFMNNSYTQTFEFNLREMLTEAGLKEKRDYIIRYRSAQGDMTNLAMLIDAAVTDEADLMILFQSPVLYTAIKKAPNIQKIFTLLQNPFILGAGQSDNAHIANLTGMYIVPPIDELLQKISECEPKIKRLGTLYLIGNEDSIYRKDELIKSATKRNIEVVAEGYNSQNDVIDAANSLFSKNIDAAFHLQDPAQDITFPAMYNPAKNYRKPVFSVVYNMEKIGASVVCSTDRDEIGRKFGAMVARVLKGGSPTDMPFENDLELPKHFKTNPAAVKDARLILPLSLIESPKL